MTFPENNDMVEVLVMMDDHFMKLAAQAFVNDDDDDDDDDDNNDDDIQLNYISVTIMIIHHPFESPTGAIRLRHPCPAEAFGKWP